MKKKVIGIIMLLIFFGCLITALSLKEGWYPVMMAFLAAIAISGFIFLAVWLIVS